MHLIFFLSGILLFTLENIITFISIREREFLAARRSFFISLILAIPFILLALINFPFRNIIGYSLLAVGAFSGIILLLPFPQRNRKYYKKPAKRLDERDTMFSRNRLAKGTENYQNYYKNNPDKRAIDDRIRKNPGLLSPESKFYHKQWFQAADTNFKTVKDLRKKVNGPVVTNKQINCPPQENTNFIKNWLNELGVLDTGVTCLKDHHVYSHGGRDERYGKKFEPDHEFAIAFTVPMDFGLVNCAPQAPIVFESSRRYLQSAQIAVNLARYIRSGGFPARAHIDGNYKVICPLVARDAGLGEIGRMGILITPQHGPRARIGVVTTNLPLIPDPPEYSSAVIDFCENCKKCARVCPSNAIPFDGRKPVNDVKRWRINQESCFQYWTEIGTDCGQCMRACPYSHPDNFFHNLIRKGIDSSPLFRKLASVMDDFFYGKNPVSKEMPDWETK
jgi:reductive dehalogenase